MTFYELLLFVHIFSAILGMGPGFVMIFVVKKATTMTELRHAYAIRNQLHIFVMIGGTLLLITGLIMGFLNPALFKQGWYILSLTLYLIALAFGPILLSPKSKPIKALLKEHKGEDIPKEYTLLANKLFFVERLENTIFLIVIALMILKPF
ncbi:DUF2269 family protein [Ornithinibacillus halophilus]|uniref:Predicted integral membrane protein n=1 Tax=Ornithinibacillus halophilus TaxID=930117 RepID=A0A1M5NX95_9BACI|nr:DUF2269 family protein [Ornithinibacillus halophilus]SHG93779.1 Predicted integral membrane protein [Ornithinibacillus halophilus]